MVVPLPVPFTRGITAFIQNTFHSQPEYTGWLCHRWRPAMLGYACHAASSGDYSEVSDL